MKMTASITAAEEMMTELCRRLPVDRLRNLPISRFLLILAILYFAFQHQARSQQKDFQSWNSAQISLQLNKNLNVNLEEEVRFRENCSQIDRQFNDLGVGYKFSKFLRINFYYRISSVWDNPGNNEWKQGFHGDILLKYGITRFQLGYRARFMTARIALRENNDRLLTEIEDRHKFSVEYNIKSLPLNPFVESELFFKLQNGKNTFTNLRGWAGMSYTPGNRHKFSLKYGFDREVDTKDPLTLYILSFSYSLNLKL